MFRSVGLQDEILPLTPAPQGTPLPNDRFLLLNYFKEESSKSLHPGNLAARRRTSLLSPCCSLLLSNSPALTEASFWVAQNQPTLTTCHLLTQTFPDSWQILPGCLPARGLEGQPLPILLAPHPLASASSTF